VNQAAGGGPGHVAGAGPSAGGLVVVIAGPSGVGKGTVTARVLDALPEAEFSVSATTRAPRGGERDGVDYHFVDDRAFDAMVAGDALVEWAAYAGNRYGTPRGPLEEALARGAVVLLDIEVQGALQVKERLPEALLVFLTPPDMDELERRLRARATDAPEAVATRLARAREEMADVASFDLVVVNDDLDRCVAEVLAGIAAARGGS
jgi:guanylate kinase